METDTNKYKVSVILTLFNSRDFFRRAIDSVLKQSYKNYELIIVDDGSTDGIETELFPVLKNNNNFKYIRHQNCGHPLSLNAGIINSSGKFITFIDSDDEYKNTHIEDRVNYFMKNKDNVDLIHSPATIIGDEKDFYVPDARDMSKLIHIDECIIGGTFFGKREVFEELGGFADVYSHDSEFYERAKAKFFVRKLESPTYIYYRNNPDSVISKIKNRNQKLT